MTSARCGAAGRYIIYEILITINQVFAHLIDSVIYPCRMRYAYIHYQNKGQQGVSNTKRAGHYR